MGSEDQDEQVLPRRLGLRCLQTESLDTIECFIESEGPDDFAHVPG